MHPQSGEFFKKRHFMVVKKIPFGKKKNVFYAFMDEWIESMREYLVKYWGLSSSFAVQVALLYAYLWQYNLLPQITSGFRDPKYQAQLVQNWDRGIRSGLVRRPAIDSLHSRTDNRGKPHALAIDISNRDHETAGQIARYLGIGWGGDFKGSGYDPIHFFDKQGSGSL